MFESGVGVHAPSRLLYEVRAGYKLLTALCFLDETMLDTEFEGLEMASTPSVVCSVYMDGERGAVNCAI